VVARKGTGMPGSLVFPRGSHVLEYWLAHAEGFTVRSRGSVESVIVEPLYGRATALVVRSGPFRRRRVVSAAEVTAVDPAARVLDLEPKPAPVPKAKPRKAPREPRVTPWLRAARAWTAPRLRSLARVARAAAGEAWAATLVLAAAAVEAARTGFERAVRWYEQRAHAPYLYDGRTGRRLRP
jgi:hypothetical protein